jgi:hypothetical protein
MATDWTDEQISAYNDIKEDGFAITVRVPGSPGVFSPTTLAYVGATANVDYSTYGIKKEFSIKQVDGTIIQQNDVLLIFPAYGLPDVTTDHQILIDSVVQNVVNLNSVEPGNTPVLYKAQIRK